MNADSLLDTLDIKEREEPVIRPVACHVRLHQESREMA